MCQAITTAIKLSAAGFVPLMVAVLAKGAVSSFILTFVGLFLLWFMNGVAEALDNPFRKHARSVAWARMGPAPGGSMCPDSTARLRARITL